MKRKVAAAFVFLAAFGVFLFDQLYKLRALEWVPDVLGPILIVATMYIWNPEWLARTRKPK